MLEVIIIGGGAAGMAAALRAAETGNYRVTLLERQGRVGRKLLSTGNGRCNLTNTGAYPGDYFGFGASDSAAAFAAPVLERYPPEKILALFHSYGLKTEEEYGGRVYPYSGQAASVLDVLRLAMARLGVNILTGAAAESIRSGPGGLLTVAWDGGGARAERVIVACGGCAGGKLGGVRDGYRLLESLGHGITPLRPALCPVRTEPEYPRALKGVRVKAGAALWACGEKKPVAATEGDVLFTETGLSGSAIFDLSLQHALTASKTGARISLDFFPGEPKERVFALLTANAARWPEEPANRVFTGLLQSRLGLMLCKRAGIGGNRAAKSLTKNELAALAETAKAFILPVTGDGGFDNAQITVGGARTEEFDPETLQSRRVPGLYACGEVLDIAARCGGYNLHWAWASGFTAGELR